VNAELAARKKIDTLRALRDDYEAAIARHLAVYTPRAGA